MKAALVLIAVAACTEAVPRELVVVAHQDDDLLFMQPVLFDRVRDHLPLTVVYVSAGDDGQGLARASARQTAVRFAYGSVAGSQAWACDAIEIADHAATRCELAEARVELVFLGYPDGGVAGEAPSSLLHLWEGSIERAATVAEISTTYSRDELVESIAAIIDDTRPWLIRTLEIAATHGDDHSDHMLVGALVQLATARSTSTAPLVAYRGYNVNYDVPNVDEMQFAEASLFMRAYLACMSSCGVCGQTPCETIDDARYVGFLHRSYSVATRTSASGRLCSNAGCTLDVELDAHGLLHSDGRCLAVRDGDVVADACTHDPAHHFRLDGEGHLWSGLAPAPAPNMLYDHSSCVVDDGGRLRIGLCGAGRDVRWMIE